MRISDWSSDVCSSDLVDRKHVEAQQCVKLSLTNRSIGLILLASGNGAGNTNIVASSDQFETLPKAKSRPDRRLAPQSAPDTRTQKTRCRRSARGKAPEDPAQSVQPSRRLACAKRLSVTGALRTQSAGGHRRLALPNRWPCLDDQRSEE